MLIAVKFYAGCATSKNVTQSVNVFQVFLVFLTSMGLSIASSVVCDHNGIIRFSYFPDGGVSVIACNYFG